MFYSDSEDGPFLTPSKYYPADEPEETTGSLPSDHSDASDQGDSSDQSDNENSSDTSGRSV